MIRQERTPNHAVEITAEPSHAGSGVPDALGTPPARGSGACMPGETSKEDPMISRRQTITDKEELRVVLQAMEERCARDHEDLRRRLARIVFRPEGVRTLKALDPFSPEYRAEVARLHESIAGRTYDIASEGLEQNDIAGRVRWRTPFGQPAAIVGQYLTAFGHLVQRLNLPLGARILELGPGEGSLSEVFARMGYNLKAVDANPCSCRIARGAIQGLDTPDARHTVVCADFSTMDFRHDQAYDAIVFFESFHHVTDHAALLAKLKERLKPGGVIAFGAEPIQKRSPALPYPWGPRLDGESLRAMMTFGWMELGFTHGYFFRLLHGLGFDWRRYRLSASNWSDVVIARPCGAGGRAPLAAALAREKGRRAWSILRETARGLR
jgi:2-polyprenyl-3-methyl-5-hydroxy-6-metoxy-1,4-benzoquinol methylase